MSTPVESIKVELSKRIAPGHPGQELADRFVSDLTSLLEARKAARRAQHDADMNILVEIMEEVIGEKLQQVVDIPSPKKEHFRLLENAQRRNISGLELVYLPSIDLTQPQRLPKSYQTPLFQGGVAGHIYSMVESESLVVRPGWRIIDNRPKPNYSQAYIADGNFIGGIVQSLRDQGAIEEVIWHNDIPAPAGARFGVSYNQVVGLVAPEVDKLLETEPNTFVFPTIGEWNAEANLYHTEWGNTLPMELMSGRVKPLLLEDRPVGSADLCFMGGGSGRGGIKIVDFIERNRQDSRVGFRLQTNFLT